MVDEVQQTDFGVKLLGEMEGVDASTLVDVLGNLSIAIHQVNDDIQSNNSLQIKIKHIQPGCYDIFLGLKEIISDPLLKEIVKTAIPTAANIIAIFAGLISIRQLLKGEKPAKVEIHNENKIIIMNKEGANVTVDGETYEIYKEDQVVDTAIGKTFDSLESDEAVTGLELYDQSKNKLCEIKRSEFPQLALPSAILDSDYRIKPEEAILTVFKVVFEKGYKWQFYYLGNKISASISDENFYKMIDSGAKFSKGDKLIVDLEIKQVFDKTVETYVNKEYTVVKIKQKIQREEQNPLFPS